MRCLVHQGNGGGRFGGRYIFKTDPHCTNIDPEVLDRQFLTKLYPNHGAIRCWVEGQAQDRTESLSYERRW